MEVFLSKEVSRCISALTPGLPRVKSDGFLIGHKRGNLFFIEKILPSQQGFPPSLEMYFELKKDMEDKILGFYSFQANERKQKKILAPIFYGKIFLLIELDKADRLEIKPFVIEYDKDFFLQPIKLKSIM